MNSTDNHTTETSSTRGKLRRRLAKAAVGTVAIAGMGTAALVAASPASADSSGCDTFHNVCIAVTGGAGETVTVTGSTNGTPFGGTFTLTGPGISSSSPDEYWDPATNPGYTWSVSAAPSGEYCVSGYDDNGNNQGMACESVS